MSTAILEKISENAKAVDKNQIPARYGLELLGAQKLFVRDSLRDTARQLRQIAGEDLSVAFGIWAHTMVITYLRTAGTEYAHRILPSLEAGGRPGVTGMAPAFKEAAGAGTIDLTATPVDGGIRLNGRLASIWRNCATMRARSCACGVVVSAMACCQASPSRSAITSPVADQSSALVGK